LARDEAFSFIYPHLLAGWRAAGAQVLPFSPLADEAPDKDADLVWLPGGYPELHGGRIAAAENFLSGLRCHAQTRPVHGECGGYMVLGEGLIDKNGERHTMAGLLSLTTSHAKRKMHLGYRQAQLLAPIGGIAAGSSWRGHGFIIPPSWISAMHLWPMSPMPMVRPSPKPDHGVAMSRAAFFHMIAPA
jgi:cobyrinic acid a,c-diamide synthase